MSPADVILRVTFHVDMTLVKAPVIVNVITHVLEIVNMIALVVVKVAPLLNTMIILHLHIQVVTIVQEDAKIVVAQDVDQHVMKNAKALVNQPVKVHALMDAKVHAILDVMNLVRDIARKAAPTLAKISVIANVMTIVICYVLNHVMIVV